MLSGWIAFGIQYLYMVKQVSKLQAQTTTLRNQIKMFSFLSKDIKESYKELNTVISSLEQLKGKIENLQQKIEKGVKDESKPNKGIKNRE